MAEANSKIDDMNFQLKESKTRWGIPAPFSINNLSDNGKTVKSGPQVLCSL